MTPGGVWEKELPKFCFDKRCEQVLRGVAMRVFIGVAMRVFIGVAIGVTRGVADVAVAVSAVVVANTVGLAGVVSIGVVIADLAMLRAAPSAREGSQGGI